MINMNHSLIKQLKNYFTYNENTIEDISEKFNNKYYHLLPRKFLFIKQYIDVYPVSNSVVIDFPSGMDIPRDLIEFLSNDSFYYTVFLEYFNGKSKVLITNTKKGEYING